MRAPDLRRTGRRLRVARVLLVAAFALLGARAVHLAAIDGRGAQRGDAQTGTALRLAPARGAIVDRNGAALAVTVQAPSVYAVPRRISDRDAATVALARAMGVDAERVRERLARRSGFVFLRRWVDPGTAEAVRALELSGVGIVDEPRRAYPHGALAGPLVGFANVDGEGARGVEQMEDAWLRGHAQRIAVERDARGRLLAHAGVNPRAAAGGDVALTLDAALQAEVDAALGEIVEATGAKGGLVMMMDPWSGDVLALAERPGFDPAHFRTTPYAKTRSRAFLDAAEPGSTLKPFVVAAALEAGVLEPDEAIDTEEGFFRVPGKTIRDLRPHGRLDPADVLRVSSNIGAAKIGFRLGAERHFEALRELGFGEPTGSGFPDESAGLLRPADAWRPVDHATVSFGQGLSVTAAQMASAFATFATGGVWRAPRLVAARREPGGDWRQELASPGRRVLRREVATGVLTMLQGVVGPEGTARRAALFGLPVAGKTGTAQKLDPATGSYSDSRYLAWFVGVAPADDPRLVTVVMLDEPKGRAHTGGATAAPLFARAAASGLSALGIPTRPEAELPAYARADWEPPATPARETAPPARQATARDAGAGRAATAPSRPEPPSPSAAETARETGEPTPWPTPPSVVRLGDRVLVPDLRGLSEGQVRQLLAGAALAAELRGRGHAVAQSPAPGTILAGPTPRVRVRFAPREGG